MPPLARMLVPALEDLARQLRFAPREALLRDIERAEALAPAINGESFYDEAWIVEQVTGYQPKIDSPATIVGSALLSDLSAFVERLSESARLTSDDLPAGWMDPDALGKRWNLSRKTLDRYRKRGLCARRIVGPDARVRLAFAPGVIAAFEAAQQPALQRARGFSRISADDEARMIRRAARYRAAFNCTLNEAARRLATRFDRSLEAVRQVLQRHDRENPSGRIFTEPGPPDARFERLAWRAWRRAIDPGLLATRSKRSRVSVVRAINHQRARLLRSAFGTGRRENGTAAQTLAWLSQAQVDKILTSQPARTGLGAPVMIDALAWIEVARRSTAPLGVEERLRAQAYHLLLSRVASITAGLSNSIPEAERLDEAETLLRWAARLKVELIRSQQGLLLRAMQSRLARPLEEVRAADLAPLVSLGVAAIADAVDSYDPFSTAGTGKLPGRLAAPASLALDRAIARWVREHPQGEPGRVRATPRLSGSALLADWTGRVAPWQAWFEPDPRVRLGAASLPDPRRSFLLRRFGWDGGPPATLDQIASAFSLTRIVVVAHERNLVRAALAAARTEPPA